MRFIPTSVVRWFVLPFGLLLTVLLAVTSVSACRGARSSVEPSSGVTGHIALAPEARRAATRGTLFVSWMTLDEKQALDAGKWTP